jgi:hypothetical protein
MATFNRRTVYRNGGASYSREGVKASIYVGPKNFADGVAPETIEFDCANLTVPGEAKRAEREAAREQARKDREAAREQAKADREARRQAAIDAARPVSTPAPAAQTELDPAMSAPAVG